MATLTLGAADLVRRRGLRQMRAVALALLVLAAVIYVVTLHRSGGWAYVNAAAEAAMVGALADWFAVTALFRRPLGLPIPHTAIVPTRKDSLAESLEQFVTENFLSEEVVGEKMRTAEVSRRAGEWLAAGNHAERIVAEGARTVGAALPKLGDDDVTAFVSGSLLPRFVKEPLSPIAGHFVESVVDDGAHHALLDLLLVEAHDWLADNKDLLADVVGPRAPRWSPQWVDRMVIDRIHREALAWLADVRDNQSHPARRAIDRLLGQLAHDLQHDPDTMARFEAWKARMLDAPGHGFEPDRGLGRDADRVDRLDQRPSTARSGRGGSGPCRSWGNGSRTTSRCARRSTPARPRPSGTSSVRTAARSSRSSPTPSNAGTAAKPPPASNSTSAATSSSSASTARSSEPWSASPSTP